MIQSNLFLRIFPLPALLILLVSGCAELDLFGPPPKQQRELPDYSYSEPSSSKSATRLPWELWTSFQDLSGKRLSNQDLLLGDELLEVGKRRSALDAYLKAASIKLLPRESEAQAVRLSSQYLAIDQPKKALAVISGYFKERGLSESNVDNPFSLLLAFAYGRQGDVDQSLAWFARSYRQSKGAGPHAEVSARGLTAFLQSLKDGSFERIALNWRSDSFVNGTIGKERLRRSSRSYDPDDQSHSAAPFWTVMLGSVVKDETIPTSGEPTRTGGSTLGVILSLSDKFGALGRDTKQGIELAVAADRREPKLNIEVRDVGADVTAASAAVRELVAAKQVSAIVGPLLTEAATSAAETAREVKVPLVSFSKSESFKTGGGVFRLGATTTSQVEALVNVAAGEYGITRFAVLAPQSSNGTEFTQVLRKVLRVRNLDLVYESVYPSTDYATLSLAATELEKSGAQAVLLPDGLDVSSNLLSAFSPTAKKKIRPLGTALWDNPTKIANSQAVFERALFVSPFFPNSSRSVVRNFADSYSSKFNASPNFLAAQGFDVATLIVAALRQSQADAGSFEEALTRQPPYDGVTGLITVHPNSEIRRALYVIEVTKDSFLEKSSAPERLTERQNQSDRPKVTYRGDNRISGSNGIMRSADATVESGY